MPQLATLARTLGFGIAVSLAACSGREQDRWVPYYDEGPPYRSGRAHFFADRERSSHVGATTEVWTRIISAVDTLDTERAPGNQASVAYDTTFQKLAVDCGTRRWKSLTPPRRLAPTPFEEEKEDSFSAFGDSMFSHPLYFWRPEWTEARPESREERHLLGLCAATR